MSPTDPNPIPALRQLRTDLHADLLELIERIGAQLSPADLEALATDASVQAILARLDHPLTVNTGLTGLASEAVQLQVRDALTGLSAVLGSTDGLEQIGTQQIALQTLLNGYIQQMTGYTDGLEGLLTSLGSNTDGLETLLAQLGVKDDNVLTVLTAIRDRLLGTLSVGGAVMISNLPATQPVSGTVNVGNLPATQPVSLASQPLPLNAASELSLQQLIVMIARELDSFPSTRALPYSRTPSDAMRVVIESGVVNNSGYWGASNVYPVWYSTGAPNSMDPREQQRELSLQSFMQARLGRWKVT